MMLLFLLNSAALGVGLAMDAFSVSLANGLCEPNMSARRMCGIAGVYAFFQYAMPMIGWICVHTVAELFRWFDRLVPWIAFGLLSWIGIGMIREGLHVRKAEEKTTTHQVLSGKVLLLQGIATSIDALSVGFTIADYGLVMANAASLIIAGVTFLLCFCALSIAKKAAGRLAWRANILGGCILTAIGLEILLQRL